MSFTEAEKSHILKMLDFFSGEDEHLDPNVLDAIRAKLNPGPRLKLFQFSATRNAFATVNVYAKDIDEARALASSQAEMINDAGWSLDAEIEIDGFINSNGELQVFE